MSDQPKTARVKHHAEVEVQDGIWIGVHFEISWDDGRLRGVYQVEFNEEDLLPAPGILTATVKGRNAALPAASRIDAAESLVRRTEESIRADIFEPVLTVERAAYTIIVSTSGSRGMRLCVYRASTGATPFAQVNATVRAERECDQFELRPLTTNWALRVNL